MATGGVMAAESSLSQPIADAARRNEERTAVMVRMVRIGDLVGKAAVERTRRGVGEAHRHRR